MQLDIRNEGAVAVLTLPDSLNGTHAAALKIFLRHSLDRAGRLIVNCEQVSSIDPDCLRILCAAYRISQVLRKEIIMAGGRPDHIFRAGESEHSRCAGCYPEAGERCLWECADADIGQPR